MHVDILFTDRSHTDLQTSGHMQHILHHSGLYILAELPGHVHTSLYQLSAVVLCMGTQNLNL